MSGKVFVDTNVLIYAHDLDAGSKHEVARSLLRDMWESGSGSLSTQVLHEFYVNVTRKIPKPLPKSRARSAVESYAPWCVPIGVDEIATAFRIEDEARIGFWDALIVAGARRAAAAVLLTEDLNAGQTIAGVRIENPFRSKRGGLSGRVR